MCNYCFEHTRKVWYLQKESYDLRSGRFLKLLPGRFREWWYNFYSPKLQSLVDKSTSDIGANPDREPYKGLTKAFYNYFAKNFLGGQVVNSLDEMLGVIDLSEDIYVSYCSCKKTAGGGEDFRCLFLNHNARFQRKRQIKGKAPDAGRFIDQDEAKEFIINKRKDGHYGTVLWGLRPKVDCICNCDQYCAGLYTPEIRWGLLPSLTTSIVSNPDRCDPDCTICTDTCYAKAIIKSKEGYTIAVDQDKCIGCNLCVERCPRGVFTSKPRKVYYDAAIGKKIEIH
ncbi:MAG: 4Fe-4S dicluster domain-containing protein [Candidatus Hodarchaeales archaeon]